MRIGWLSALFAAGCTAAPAPPLRSEGSLGVGFNVTSPDGLLTIVPTEWPFTLPGPDSPTDIEMRPDELAPSGSRRSAGYRIGPIGDLRGRAELVISVGGLTSTNELILGVERDGVIGRLQRSRYLPNEGTIRAELDEAVDGVYGVYELPYEPCQGRACGESCARCSPSDVGCVEPEPTLACDGERRCVSRGELACTEGRLPPGWDDAPGTGAWWLISYLVLAHHVGFDLDGHCLGPGLCEDELLSDLPQQIADPIREMMNQHKLEILLEIVGVDLAGEGDGTLKVYDGLFVSDHEEKILNQSLAGMPVNARARVPIRIRDGELTVLGSTGLALQVGAVRVDHALLHARLRHDHTTLEGEIGAAIKGATLAQIQNPFCDASPLTSSCPSATSGSMLDLAALTIRPQPDLDLDGDGLETFIDADGDGHVDSCLDGCLTDQGCSAPQVVAPGLALGGCALDVQMSDAYSFGATFEAVPVTVVGVAAN